MASKKANRSATVELNSRACEPKTAKLTIMNSWFAGLEIQLKKKRTTLGRSVRCDICLDDSLVSDEHAAIVRSEDGFFIEDLNSRNGLLVNGKAVHNGKLRSGDTIEIGSYRIKFTCERT